MLTLARIAAITLAAVVLMLTVSVCGEAVACSTCDGPTCCEMSGRTPPRNPTPAPMAKAGLQATLVATVVGVPVCGAVELSEDDRLAAPPPDLLLANLRV